VVVAVAVALGVAALRLSLSALLLLGLSPGQVDNAAAAREPDFEIGLEKCTEKSSTPIWSGIPFYLKDKKKALVGSPDF